jgi:hypothetical protein
VGTKNRFLNLGVNEEFIMGRIRADAIYTKAILNGVSLECTCVDVTLTRWEDLMVGATRADKKQVEKLIDLPLSERKYRNPYVYYKTSTHLIYVHSSIEYFYRIH